jgi:integrase
MNCYTQVSHRRPIGIWRRGAVYQYRVRVPRELNPLVGRTHINRSLGTTSITIARRLARSVAFGIEEQFEVARTTGVWLATQYIVHPGASKAVDGCQLPSSDRSPITIAELCERYLVDPTMQRTPKSAVVYRTTFRTIIEILGEDFPVSSMSRDACRSVLKALQVLPGNARKRWPTLSLNEILDEAKRTRASAMSAANANEYMNKLSSLLNWAVKEEIAEKNPAKGLRIPEALTAREKRQPFAIEQLRRIFDAPLFRGCRDDENGYAVRGPKRPRRARFWIPLIALFGGMRQGEICQLGVADVRTIDGILCFDVSATDGDGKRLKTSASRRIVPVHPLLLRMGFASYIEQARRKNEQRLFPELMIDSVGTYSGKFSKWFSRFLVSADATADRTCFHSFRHCFRDALREASIDRELALTIGGWTTSSGLGGAAVADTYGRGYSAAMLHSAIASVRYPALDLNHLYTR